MHSKTRKILYPIITFIVIALTMTSCYSQSKVSEFSVGNEKMQEGVIQEPLYLGKEQLIRFDKHTGAHIYLTEYEIDEELRADEPYRTQGAYGREIVDGAEPVFLKAVESYGVAQAYSRHEERHREGVECENLTKFKRASCSELR